MKRPDAIIKKAGEYGATLDSAELQTLLSYIFALEEHIDVEGEEEPST